MSKLLNQISAKANKHSSGRTQDKGKQYTYDDAISAIVSSNLGSFVKEDYINNDIIKKDLDSSYYAGIVEVCSKKNIHRIKQIYEKLSNNGNKVGLVDKITKSTKRTFEINKKQFLAMLIIAKIKVCPKEVYSVITKYKG